MRHPLARHDSAASDVQGNDDRSRSATAFPPLPLLARYCQAHHPTYTQHVGRLFYQHTQAFDIDDRVLAHLRVAVMNKLRRGESFMLQLPSQHGVGTHSLWFSPSVPIAMQFYGGRAPALDMELIEEMMAGANSSEGLTLL